MTVAPCYGSLSDDTPVGRFKAYLRIATVHPEPDYQPPVDFLFAQAKEIGLEARTLEYAKGKPVTLLTWKGTNPSLPSVLLNSHVDVVPAEKTKWVHEPFAAIEVHAHSLSSFFTIILFSLTKLEDTFSVTLNI